MNAMNSNQENFEKAFYSDGFKIGMKAVQNGLTNHSLFSAMEEMYVAIDYFIDSLSNFAQQQGNPIQCKKGCEWCCYQPIFALDYELDFLSSFLSNSFDKKRLKEIKKRAQQKQSKLTVLKGDDLLNSKYPCPLLENGSCIAYKARPMACRIYLSSNVNSCLTFYQKPDDKTNYPALLEFPLSLGRMMNEGFKASMKMYGLEPKEFRIEEKLDF